MKLRNKLIPLAAVAIATSSIAPITLVSCGSKSDDQIKLNDISTAELAEPKDIEKYIDGKVALTEETATNDYYNWVKKSPDLFVEDLAWGVYKNWYSYFDENNFTHSFSGRYYVYSSKINSLKFGATQPVVTLKTIKRRGGKGEVTYPAISFKMKVVVDANVKTNSPDEKGIQIEHSRDIHFECETEYKDVLFFAYKAYADQKDEYFNSVTASSSNAQAAPGKINTTDTCWYITSSDLSDSQTIYEDYYDDWYTKYNAKYSIADVETNTVTGLSYATLNEGESSKNINTLKDFDMLLSYKHYMNSNAFWSWFETAPMSLAANAVLLDLQSYYFDDAYVSPTFTTESSLQGVAYYDEDGNPHLTSIHGWEVIPANWDDLQEVETIKFNYYKTNKDGEIIGEPIENLKVDFDYGAQYDPILTLASGDTVWSKSEHSGDIYQIIIDVPVDVKYPEAVNIGMSIRFVFPDNIAIKAIIETTDGEEPIDVLISEIKNKSIYYYY